MQSTATTIDRSRDPAREQAAAPDPAAPPRARAAAWEEPAGFAVLSAQLALVVSAAVLAGANDVQYRAPAMIVFLVSLAAVQGGHRVLRASASRHDRRRAAESAARGGEQERSRR